jgi:hypothetical protein
MPKASNHLQSRIPLSRQEMCMISHAISRDFSPRLFRSRMHTQAQRLFTPQELLEISQQISREYAPSRVSHQSRLVLLAVSPRRLHAYWHVAKRLLNNALERIEAEEPMALRIFAEPDVPVPDVSGGHTRQDWFDIAINVEEGQQDIFLPSTMTTHAPMHFSAALGKMDNNQRFTPLTFSNATEAPPINQPSQWIELSKTMAPFIMSDMNSVSSVVKTASSQGKDLKHE